MWKAAFILCLLNASELFAAESRATFRVGITITGNRHSSAVKPKRVGVVPLPMARPANFVVRDRARSAR